MTTTEPTNPRKLAQDALEQDKKASFGPWVYDKSNPLWPICTAIQQPVISTRNTYIDEESGYLDYPYMRDEDGQFMAASRQLVPDLAKALIAALDRNAVAARYANAKKAFDDEAINLSIEKDRLRDEYYKAGVNVYQIQSRVNWEVQFNSEIEDEYKQARTEFEKAFGVSKLI